VKEALPGTPVVHVVEDDDSSRRATERLLKAAGHCVRVYASPAEFLNENPDGPGCLVLDLHLPGVNGLELQTLLATGENPLPVVFVTGHGDVPKSVRAMKAGALDFLMKPVDPPVLLSAVAHAIAKNLEQRATYDRRRDARTRYERLTPREGEVFAHVISGQLNKQIAYDLGTTEHTIKVHRHRVMAKLGVDSVAEMVRLAADLDITPIGSARE